MNGWHHLGNNDKDNNDIDPKYLDDRKSGPWPQPFCLQTFKKTEVTHVYTHIRREMNSEGKKGEEMMRHTNELMIGVIQDMQYYRIACDLLANVTTRLQWFGFLSPVLRLTGEKVVLLSTRCYLGPSVYDSLTYSLPINQLTRRSCVFMCEICIGELWLFSGHQ